MTVGDVSTHASLLARLRATDDEAAWHEFADRCREHVFLFARRRGLQAADADDVVQETLAAAHKAAATFEYDPAKGKFRGCLKTVALRARLKRARPGADAMGRADLNDDAVRATASEPANDEAWETEWRKYHVRLATAKVRFEFNAKDVAAFEACAVEGRAPSEVAVLLGVSVDSVYQAKSRVIRRLCEHVAAQVAEEG